MLKIKWFTYKIGRLFEKIREKMIKYFYKIRFRVKYIPYLLQIETTNRCNANCGFCRREFVEIQPDMELSVFKKIIDAMPFVTEVQLQGFGEPLIDPTIVEKVEYANKKGMRTLFYTNAATLSSRMGLKLLEAGLNQIRISIDDNTKEGYEEARTGLVWNKVLNNIETFRKMRDEGNHPTSMTVAICITDINRERLDGIIEFWKERVDFVGAEDVVYIPTPEDLTPRYVDSESVECGILYDRITVKTNGDLSMCSIDLYNMYPMGNLKEIDSLTSKKILDMYNGSDFNNIRDSLKNGKNMPSRCVYCCRNPNSVV